MLGFTLLIIVAKTSVQIKESQMFLMCLITGV